MRTFAIQTLGCKVNQYESEQVATLLRSRGLVQVESVRQADVRIVNTCSVTTEAASKSRQTTRRLVRLPLYEPPSAVSDFGQTHDVAESREKNETNRRGRVIVIGCWATSNKGEATSQAGVDAVLGHSDDVAGEIDRLLINWRQDDQESSQVSSDCTQGSDRDDGSMNLRAGTPGRERPPHSKPQHSAFVKPNLADPTKTGARSLPLLDDRHTGHQRAFLKIQDGCDAHCTYCIIPQLRPTLWSKPVEDAVAEATRLVETGHREMVLTGIFLGAFGQPTALRRRQPNETGQNFTRLIEALCTRVPRLHRLRISSLEPGDLTDSLIDVLRSFRQVVPHFHLPLQSGSDLLLRKMNRQYTRDDFLRMVDRVNTAFDRPALTTDIIVGFPGETDVEFERTLEVVDRTQFIHIHAFPFSPRPGTAALRWSHQFIPRRVTSERMTILKNRAAAHSFAFRSRFVGSEVEILVERTDDPAVQHGRCERYFDVHIQHDSILTGRAVRARIDRVSPSRTLGTIVSIDGSDA